MASSRSYSSSIVPELAKCSCLDGRAGERAALLERRLGFLTWAAARAAGGIVVGGVALIRSVFVPGRGMPSSPSWLSRGVDLGDEEVDCWPRGDAAGEMAMPSEPFFRATLGRDGSLASEELESGVGA